MTPIEIVQKGSSNGASSVHTIRIAIEARGPLLFGSSLGGSNIMASLSHITGSAWRGAIARTILDGLGTRKRGWEIGEATPTAEFEEIFGGASPTKFRSLYPVRHSAPKLAQSQALPLPLTARQCKQVPGFTPDGHDIYDSLLSRIRWAIRGGSDGAVKNMCPWKGCQGRLERIRGYAGYHPTEPVQVPASGTYLPHRQESAYRQEKVGRHSHVRVGLNRYTETAQERILFVHDALEQGVDSKGNAIPLTFLGSWQGTAAQEEILCKLLDEHFIPVAQNVYELRIGAAKARGMGETHLYLLDQDEESTTEKELEARFDRFQPRGNGGYLLDNEHLYASLTLRAPMLLLDSLGMPSAIFAKETFDTYAPAVPASLELMPSCSVIEQEAWGGWSTVWGLPKPVTQVISPSSVIVLKAKQSERTAFLNFLRHIALHGLGEQRAVGLGELQVCADFHLTYDEGLVAG